MKRRIVTITTSLTLFLFASSLDVSIPAYAQESNQQAFNQSASRTTLTVTPPLSEIIIKPGKAITQAFTIKNEGKIDLEVTPTIIEFSPDGKTGAPILLLKNKTFPFASLENLDKKLNAPFKLKAGASDQLVVKIVIPEKAEEKEYYQTLLFQTRPIGLELSDGTTSTSQAWIGVHMLISISKTGEQLGDLRIHNFKYPKIIDMFSPIKLDLIVKNQGKNFVKAQGEIKITALTNDVVKVFPILPENVLANSVRTLHASLPDPEDPKSASAASFEYRPVFLLGPYTISVNVYAENQKQEPVLYTTYALPISPTIALFAVFILNKLVKKYQALQVQKSI